jgi:hypothetical protein
MDESTRIQVARCLEVLADQETWNPEIWQRCYDLVGASLDSPLVAYVYDDVIHYSGLFHSRNIFSFRVRPNRSELADYRQEFRDVSSALRDSISLGEAKRKYGL